MGKRKCVKAPPSVCRFVVPKLCACEAIPRQKRKTNNPRAASPPAGGAVRELSRLHSRPPNSPLFTPEPPAAASDYARAPGGARRPQQPKHRYPPALQTANHAPQTHAPRRRPATRVMPPFLRRPNRPAQTRPPSEIAPTDAAEQDSPPPTPAPPPHRANPHNPRPPPPAEDEPCQTFSIPRTAAGTNPECVQHRPLCQAEHCLPPSGRIIRASAPTARLQRSAAAGPCFRANPLDAWIFTASAGMIFDAPRTHAPHAPAPRAPPPSRRDPCECAKADATKRLRVAETVHSRARLHFRPERVKRHRPACKALTVCESSASSVPQSCRKKSDSV